MSRLIVRKNTNYVVIIDTETKAVFIESDEGDLFSIVAGVLPRGVRITDELVERIVEAVRSRGASEAARIIRELGGRAAELTV